MERWEDEICQLPTSVSPLPEDPLPREHCLQHLHPQRRAKQGAPNSANEGKGETDDMSMTLGPVRAARF